MIDDELAVKIFRSQNYMNQKQQNFAKDFIDMIEPEYELCVREIRKASKAITVSSTEYLSDEEYRKVDLANREIDSIQMYWQNRLECLISFIETKSIKLNKEIAKNYLANE